MGIFRWAVGVIATGAAGFLTLLGSIGYLVGTVPGEAVIVGGILTALLAHTRYRLPQYRVVQRPVPLIRIYRVRRFIFFRRDED